MMVPATHCVAPDLSEVRNASMTQERRKESEKMRSTVGKRKGTNKEEEEEAREWGEQKRHISSDQLFTLSFLNAFFGW